MGTKLEIVNARATPLSLYQDDASRQVGELRPGDECYYWLDRDSRGLIISVDRAHEEILVLWSVSPKFKAASTNPCGEIPLAQMHAAGMISKKTMLREMGLDDVE